jgi:CO/xanthine dehydrogenase FAD-binding subunit
VRIPARPPGAVGVRQARRRRLTISISTVAVVVDVDANGAIAEAGVAVGSCSAVARRPPARGTLIGVAADADLAGVLELADLAPLMPIDDRAAVPLPPRRDCHARASRPARVASP